MQSVDHVILGMIGVYPSSGYDMKVELESGGAGMFSALTFGSIYPRLKALEEEGYVVSYEADTHGRRRRVYELTAKGWRALAEWLAAEPDYPLPMRDELLLKISFWGAGRDDDRAPLIEHLRRRRRQSEELLAHLDEWPHNGYSLISEYGMLAIDYSQRRIRAELEWIDSAIAQLEGPPTGPVQDPRHLREQQRARRALALGEVTAETAAPAEAVGKGAGGAAQRARRPKKPAVASKTGTRQG